MSSSSSSSSSGPIPRPSIWEGVKQYRLHYIEPSDHNTFANDVWQKILPKPPIPNSYRRQKRAKISVVDVGGYERRLQLVLCVLCDDTSSTEARKDSDDDDLYEVGNAQPAILSSNPLRTRYSLKEPKCTYYYYILTSIVVILYILLFSIKIKNTQIAGVAGVAGSYQVHRKTVFTDSTYL